MFGEGAEVEEANAVKERGVMTDADRMEQMREIVKAFRTFYNENGYLPHKAAERLIIIAEELLK